MDTLILPGLHGSDDDHWQSWWTRVDGTARIVEQSNWDSPRFDEWRDTIIAAVEDAPGALIVAHSLACALVAQLAADHPGLEIGGALLVAPADVDDQSWTSPQVAGFGPMRLVRFSFPAIVAASRDDPYVAVTRARTFARAWGADFVDLGNRGHVNARTGFGPWPEGRRLAGRLTRTVGEDSAREAAHAEIAGAA